MKMIMTRQSASSWRAVSGESSFVPAVSVLRALVAFCPFILLDITGTLGLEFAAVNSFQLYLVIAEQRLSDFALGLVFYSTVRRCYRAESSSSTCARPVRRTPLS